MQSHALAGVAEQAANALKTRIAEQSVTINQVFDGMAEKGEKILEMGRSQSEFLANASEQATVVAVAMRETLKDQIRALNTAANEISARAAEAGEALGHHVADLTSNIRRTVEENADGLNRATAAVAQHAAEVAASLRREREDLEQTVIKARGDTDMIREVLRQQIDEITAVAGRMSAETATIR